MEVGYIAFDQELNELRDLVLEMGGSVEAAIGDAIQALLYKDLKRCDKVFELEENINKFHILIDDVCWKLLARRSPVATNLRAILAAIKINTDLERMGDLAVNIAYNSEIYIHGKEISSVSTDLLLMTGEVQKMVKLSLDSLVTGSVELAREVIKLDDVIDNLKNRIIKSLVAEIKKNIAAAEEAVSLLLIAKNLERIGDHATNISEDVIFMTMGKDIRHRAELAEEANGKN